MKCKNTFNQTNFIRTGLFSYCEEELQKSPCVIAMWQKVPASLVLVIKHHRKVEQLRFS